jgi:hypothetical protein
MADAVVKEHAMDHAGHILRSGGGGGTHVADMVAAHRYRGGWL